MESCLSVQRELDKVVTKFTGLHDHYSNTIEDFTSSIENIRRELAEGTVIDQNLHPFVAIFFLFFSVFVMICSIITEESGSFRPFGPGSFRPFFVVGRFGLRR